MHLKNKEKFNHIPDCPNQNEKEEKELFRCVIKENLIDSFKPLALEKPKYKDNCQAWGLSVFKNKEAAIQKLKNLSLKKSMNGIAVALLSEKSGIKHQSGNDINHYTFYPSEDFSCHTEFIIIEDGK